jgi:predicted ester cyclase
MSIEETNKAIVRRYFESVGKKTGLTMDEAMDEFLSPNFVDHNPDPGCPGGAHCDYYKQINKEFAAAFSDAHATINDLIAEGDKVVAYTTNAYTHTGVFRGKPPTGKQVSFSVITIYRLADGKIVESWDDIGLHTELEQLLEP